MRRVQRFEKRVAPREVTGYQANLLAFQLGQVFRAAKPQLTVRAGNLEKIGCRFEPTEEIPGTFSARVRPRG